MSRFNLIDNYLLFLLSVIPLSILIGPSISLVNIFLIIFFFIFYYKKIFFFSLFKNKAIIGLITIYLYLLLNSLISIDYSIGFLRNFGFSKFMVTSTAPVYLAAVLEYITAEILDLSAKSASNNKRIICLYLVIVR